MIIRFSANDLSSGLRYQAVLASFANQNGAAKPKRTGTEPSRIKRYCHEYKAPLTLACIVFQHSTVEA